MIYIKDFILNFWILSSQMAPYLLLGFIIAGILRAYISDALIEQHLWSNTLTGIIKASLLGIPLPLCSCGVIPVATSLYKQGASRGATVSFLISTPQTGADNLMITWSFFGPFFAIYRICVSFVSGILGGVLVSNFVTGVSPSIPVNRSIPRSVPRWKAFKKTALIDLPRDIGKALLVGLIIGAFISMLLSPGQLDGTMSNWTGMLLALIIGLPLYVCATGSVPIAAALVGAGLSPGAALVFLMTGPATNITTIATITVTLGKRTALIYLATISAIALLSGLLFDWFLSSVNNLTVLPDFHKTDVSVLGGTSAIFLFSLLMANILFRNKAKLECCKKEPVVKKEDKKMPKRYKKIKIYIDGMQCEGCANSIERVIRGIKEVHEVDVNFDSSSAKIKAKCKSSVLIKAIEDLGYEARI